MFKIDLSFLILNFMNIRYDRFWNNLIINLNIDASNVIYLIRCFVRWAIFWQFLNSSFSTRSWW